MLFSRGLQVVLAVLFLDALQVAAHPLCVDGTAPSLQYQQQANFCTKVKNPSNKNGACCTAQQENAEKGKYYDRYNLSEQCKPYQAQVACAKCHPYAVHLLADGSGIMGMCKDWCQQYYNACKNDLRLPGDFCKKHTTGSIYCYPAVNDIKMVASSKLEPYFYNLQGSLPTQMVGMFMRPGTNKWWIINQRGQIVEVDNDRGTRNKKTIMDIRGRVIQYGASGLGEMGMLGLAFSPDFQHTGKFYINYIDNGRNTVIARFTYKAGDPNGTANSHVQLLTFHQPYENHNGGTLLFTPGDLARPSGQPHYDLYILTGDGGLANNPGNTAQDLNTRFGKVLRIRISTDYSQSSYTIPPGNLRNEVWAYGLRNPWKCSFDMGKKDNAELWCGDVGQDRIEKVIKVSEGQNHGWPYFEGTRNNGKGNAGLSYTKPKLQYCHDGVKNQFPAQCGAVSFTGESVTGGFVYRGRMHPEYYGQYIFADYQAGRILRMYKKADGNYGAAVITKDAGWTIPSLAQDNNGEIYIIKYGENSNVYALPRAEGSK